jgi:hypothetical protein
MCTRMQESTSMWGKVRYQNVHQCPIIDNMDIHGPKGLANNQRSKVPGCYVWVCQTHSCNNTCTVKGDEQEAQTHFQKGGWL